jgi:tRNA(Arg) A34 adenosine deaminase TadA
MSTSPWARRSARLALIAGVLVLAWALVHKAYVLEPEHRLADHEVAELSALGATAIGSLVVPVAALLVYQGRIIGRGYNTVRREGNAGGHAEINAISDAMRSLGPEGFDALDRDHLVLLTTFEPCAMCRGAIISVWGWWNRSR